jgi:hypothetical protein
LICGRIRHENVWPQVYAHARFYLAGLSAERRFAPLDAQALNSRRDDEAAQAVARAQWLAPE